MSAIEIFIGLFFFTTLVTAFASRLKFSVEVFLLLASLVISLLPGLPLIAIQPEVVFMLFLPPILFSASYFTAWNDFKGSLLPILLMAINLVLFSMFGIAVLIKWLIPQMSWPLSFLLGAIVSPTDAAATTPLVKKLGLPKRLITLLEGESLINDATAIIAVRFAITAVCTGAFSIRDASLAFLWMGLGGLMLGLGCSYLAQRLYMTLRESTTKNMFILALPYTVYFMAEHLKVSGVIATVAIGLFFAQQYPKISDAETRYRGGAVWEILITVINSLAFTLIGLQLQSVVQNLGQFSVSELALYAVACSGAVILIRFVWMFAIFYFSRHFPYSASIGRWKQLTILSWIGMRGIISLAAVLSIPKVLPDGTDFPLRDLLIFLTYCVTLATLLIPTLTLTKIVKLLRIVDPEKHDKKINAARLALAQTVLDFLSLPTTQASYPSRALEQMSQAYQQQIKRLQENSTSITHSDIFDEATTTRKLKKDIIDVEHRMMVKLRRHGTLDDNAFYELQEELDIEALRLKTHRTIDLLR